ncbi:hypothetical protein BCR39DRAFT_522319 [Naematelia encephala]|uniref:Uncharacterized protein n=1 Tax=Naematelia encephala TaxID=71784 RepID=A0A1Y2BDP3_9TREE|nr:hypothetical protein BCR39DRAFT_522319 [Naematelia encephala]
MTTCPRTHDSMFGFSRLRDESGLPLTKRRPPTPPKSITFGNWTDREAFVRKCTGTSDESKVEASLDTLDRLNGLCSIPLQGSNKGSISDTIFMTTSDGEHVCAIKTGRIMSRVQTYVVAMSVGCDGGSEMGHMVRDLELYYGETAASRLKEVVNGLMHELNTQVEETITQKKKDRSVWRSMRTGFRSWIVDGRGSQGSHSTKLYKSRVSNLRQFTEASTQFRKTFEADENNYQTIISLLDPTAQSQFTEATQSQKTFEADVKNYLPIISLLDTTANPIQPDDSNEDSSLNPSPGGSTTSLL